MTSKRDRAARTPALLTRFRNNFIAGLLVVLPLWLTGWILLWIMATLNAKILVPTAGAVSFVLPFLSRYQLLLITRLIILVLLVGGITAVGFGARSLVLGGVLSFLDQLLKRAPFINKIYVTIKEMANALLGHSKGFFQRVVLVEWPRKGLYTPAFVMRDAQGELKRASTEELVIVLIPTPPNPATGPVLMIPKRDTIPVDMSIEEALKFIVSMGTVLPEPKGRAHRELP
ncbi:MAG: DUF502 domain-containing protein [Candidatus Omnitrophica bacterium]|nr:DUF502 domain-containing protein [Candidatus Omnitrophota bacterium]